jgi:beta-galactosidase
MVFIASYWDQFSAPDVTVFSNCERVRLFQDGQEVAEQGPDESPRLPHPPFTFRGLQLSMGRHSGAASFENGQEVTQTWVPGELRAEGLIGGRVTATHSVRTAGVQTELSLAPDDAGRPLVADGSDFIVVHAVIRDSRGTVVPLADDLVTFEVAGEGRILGDGSIGANPMRAQAGIASALVASTRRSGKITVTARAFGLRPATLTFESVLPTDPAL